MKYVRRNSELQMKGQVKGHMKGHMKGNWSRKLNRAWRVLATGYCFVGFGLAAVILSATWFPLLRVTSRDAEQGRVRIQRAMSTVFHFFVRMMRAVGVISYELRGLEKLPRVGLALGQLPGQSPGQISGQQSPGVLIVANHPTLIDVVFLVGLLPSVDCIVKDQLWRNPFLRWPVLWAGYIPNRTAEQLVGSCAQTLQAGRSLLVFPEGTRTVPGQPFAMRRGAAQIALASRADILPITISCEPLMLAKTQAWHEAPQGRGHFIISIGEPIPATEYLSESLPQSLAARALTRRLEDYFAASLAALHRGVLPDESVRTTDVSAEKNASGPARKHSSLPLSFTANDADSHANS